MRAGIGRIVDVLPDLMMLAGLALVVRGAWLAWQPGAWIVGGCALVFAGWRLAR